MATRKQLTRSPEADKKKIIQKGEFRQLVLILAQIPDPKEMKSLLKSIFTIRETKEISRRLEIARQLHHGLTYEEIQFQLEGVGMSTIARVGLRLNQNPDIFRKIFRK